MLQDIRYGARALRKSPGFTAVAVISLALGIGVNLSIFEFIDAALFKPLPVDHPERLVSLYHRPVQGAESFTSTSYPEYEYYRDHNTVFSGMLAYLRLPMNMGSGSAARRISGELVSPDYFAVLGIRPVMGRVLTPEDTGATAVISYSLWRDSFAADPGIVGKSVRVGTGDFTVIGVAPERFRGVVMDWADPPSVWIAVSHYATVIPLMTFDIVHEWGGESYLVTGRLRPGVTVEQAAAQVASLTARLREDRGRRKEQTAVLFPVQEARFWPSYRGSILTFLGALMTIVGVVLLIGCCNLASLLLARATNRRREIAIRLAIGAGRARIARQLLIEGLLLSCLGGLAAVGVAAVASGYLEQFHRPFRIPLAIETGWDLRVLAFAIGISIAAGLFFGIAPILQTWRADVNGDLRTNSAAGKARSRLRNVLVVGQVALSTMLLAGSALFVRTLANARAQDPTLQAENLLLVPLEPAMQGYDNVRGGQFYRATVDRARLTPGVKNAALVSVVTFSGQKAGTDVAAPGQAKQQVDFNTVSSGYFQTTGLQIRRGREFNERDTETAPAVAVVNERFAANFWPGEDAIGKRFQLVRSHQTLTVVGVAEDAKFQNYRNALRPELYLPVTQRYVGAMTMAVRTAVPASELAGAVQREIQALDPAMPLTGIQTMKTRLDDSLSQERLLASLASGLGVLAIVLAAVGIYGVLSFAVSRRTREIGIRMALGARPREVAGTIVRESAVLTGAGFAIGAAGAYGLARLATGLLYGVGAADPATLGITSAALAVVAGIAAAIPAYRAAAIDPAATLRGE